MILGKLNRTLRYAASALPANFPLRRLASWGWRTILELTGTDVEIKLHGNILKVRNRWRSYSSDYEHLPLSGFLDTVKPGDVVWDVGSHIGLYGMLAARKLNGQGTVHCWEPSPTTYAELVYHLEKNQLLGVCECHQEAVTDGTADSISFEVSNLDEASSTNRLTTDFTDNKRTLRVGCHSLDYWMDALGHVPDVMKMDIEGGEAGALRGAGRLLRGEGGKIPRILLALHPASIWQYGEKLEEMKSYLKGMDFVVLNLDGSPGVLEDFTEYWVVHKSVAGEMAEKLGKYLQPSLKMAA